MKKKLHIRSELKKNPLISEINFNTSIETLSRILIWQLFYVPKKSFSFWHTSRAGQNSHSFSWSSKTFVKQTLKTKSKKQSFLVLPESRFYMLLKKAAYPRRSKKLISKTIFYHELWSLVRYSHAIAIPRSPKKSLTFRHTSRAGQNSYFFQKLQNVCQTNPFKKKTRTWVI